MESEDMKKSLFLLLMFITVLGCSQWIAMEEGITISSLEKAFNRTPGSLEEFTIESIETWTIHSEKYRCVKLHNPNTIPLFIVLKEIAPDSNGISTISNTFKPGEDDQQAGYRVITEGKGMAQLLQYQTFNWTPLPLETQQTIYVDRYDKWLEVFETDAKNALYASTAANTLFFLAKAGSLAIVAVKTFGGAAPAAANTIAAGASTLKTVIGASVILGKYYAAALDLLKNLVVEYPEDYGVWLSTKYIIGENTSVEARQLKGEIRKQIENVQEYLDWFNLAVSFVDLATDPSSKAGKEIRKYALERFGDLSEFLGDTAGILFNEIDQEKAGETFEQLFKTTATGLYLAGKSTKAIQSAGDIIINESQKAGDAARKSAVALYLYTGLFLELSEILANELHAAITAIENNNWEQVKNRLPKILLYMKLYSDNSVEYYENTIKYHDQLPMPQKWITPDKTEELKKAIDSFRRESEIILMAQQRLADQSIFNEVLYSNLGKARIEILTEPAQPESANRIIYTEKGEMITLFAPNLEDYEFQRWEIEEKQKGITRTDSNPVLQVKVTGDIKAKAIYESKEPHRSEVLFEDFDDADINSNLTLGHVSGDSLLSKDQGINYYRYNSYTIPPVLTMMGTRTTLHFDIPQAHHGFITIKDVFEKHKEKDFLLSYDFFIKEKKGENVTSLFASTSYPGNPAFAVNYSNNTLIVIGSVIKNNEKELEINLYESWNKFELSYSHEQKSFSIFINGKLLTKHLLEKEMEFLSPYIGNGQGSHRSYVSDIYYDNLSISFFENTVETTVTNFPYAGEMILVKGGTFQMGNTRGDSEGRDSETPVHTVNLTYDYHIGKYEVTFDEYDAYIEETDKSNDKVLEVKPIVYVNWWDAISYCNWLSEKEGLGIAYDEKGNLLDKDGNITSDITKVVGYRLPTEVEWEYAARGGHESTGDYKYAGSNTLKEVGWYRENSELVAHEVGEKKPNELGLYDMSGNVWEWCHDWHGDYADRTQTNPTGPINGSYRAIRSGSWRSYMGSCRITFRYGNGSGGQQGSDPNDSFDNLGFRIARTK